jgi:histidinol-phosphate phosphatase family protein
LRLLGNFAVLKQAVILAGGLGTRLRSVYGAIPKPLVPVGGIPLLHRQIDQLTDQGVKEIFVLAGFKADQVEVYVSKYWPPTQVKVRQDGTVKGTAGAVLGVLAELDPLFFVVYGDTLFDIDFTRFYKFHERQRGACASLLVHPNDHPEDSDLVIVDEQDRVCGFLPYPRQDNVPYQNLVNAALYIIDQTILVPWAKYRGDSLDFGKHVFPFAVEKGLPLAAYNSPEYIKDCGTPERISKVERDLERGVVASRSLRCEQPAIFLDRDGVINEEVGLITNPRDLKILDGAAEAIKLINRSTFRAVVVTNQPVIARGLCDFSQLRAIHNKLEWDLAKYGSYIDRLYFCPHHPDSGYLGERPELKVVCSCRKPSTGMFEQAKLDLNIDLTGSWMIGDMTSDIRAGRSAGLLSVLVETGYAGNDGKDDAQPDFVFPDLLGAVTFITTGFDKGFRVAFESTKGLESGALILIGGLARSGKSTFASLCKIALNRRMKKAFVLSTDRWIKSNDSRSEGVIGRHDVEGLRRFLVSYQSHDWDRLGVFSYNLPRYVRKTRKSFESIDNLIIEREAILILEGVMISFFKGLGSTSKFWVDVPEEIRKDRILRDLILRGATFEEAEAIYEMRLRDETPLVESGRVGSEVIKLSA